MKIHIEIGEADLTRLVLNFLSDKLNETLTEKDVIIEVKSKQNYKSEWEVASFRARVEK